MTSLLWFAVFEGCWRHSVVYEKYRVAKRQALADPGPAPASWEPDVRVELSPELVDRLITFGLEQKGAFRSEVVIGGIGKATPELEVRKLKLSAAPRCDQCFTVDLDLDGEVAWSAGLLGDGRVPARAQLVFEVELQTDREGEDFVVRGLPRDIRDVSIEVPGWSAALRRAALGPIERWLNERVEEMEPVALSRFGGTALPLRAMRVNPRGKGLSVLLLSSSPTPGSVSTDGGRIPNQGFAVWASTDSLVGFAARHAFEQGPKDYDITAVPTSLEAKRAGFTLGLRLWGIGGAGWWRDYEATGGIRVEEGEIRLAPNEVKQTGMSKGAVQADPLIHLGQSLVLESITDALRVTLPSVQAAEGTAAKATVTGISGQPNGLWVTGDLALDPD